MKILNFGSCNIDYVYTVDHILVTGETLASEGLELFPGGKGLNQSIAVARAGGEVYHAGCTGNDGKMLQDILAESGVNISYVKKVDAKNGHAVIQVSKTGENNILLYSGSNKMLTEEYIDSVLKDFSSEDMVLLQNEVNNVEYIIRQAYRKGMQIVLNPSPFDESLNKLDFTMLSYIILNEVEAKGFTGTDNPEKAIKALKERYPELKVVLTLGEKGCVYSDKEQTLYQEAFKVKTVDTTAAGDTFTGYFLSAVAEGVGYAEAIKMACKASALAVSRNGAAPSIPTRDEVLQSI